MNPRLQPLRQSRCHPVFGLCVPCSGSLTECRVSLGRTSVQLGRSYIATRKQVKSLMNGRRMPTLSDRCRSHRSEEHAGLTYVGDEKPGIRCRRSGKGFRYESDTWLPAGGPLSPAPSLLAAHATPDAPARGGEWPVGSRASCDSCVADHDQEQSLAGYTRRCGLH